MMTIRVDLVVVLHALELGQVAKLLLLDDFIIGAKFIIIIKFFLLISLRLEEAQITKELLSTVQRHTLMKSKSLNITSYRDCWPARQGRLNLRFAFPG